MVLRKSIRVALMASFGGFVVGVSLGWSGPIGNTQFVSSTYKFQLSFMHWVFICSIIAVGAAVMCIPAGMMVSAFGRKPIMLGMVVPSILGWSLVIGAQHFCMMYVGRFLIGMGNGGICVAVTLYNSEVAELEIHGMLGCLFHLMLAHGVLYAYIIHLIQNCLAYNFACGLVPLVYAIILIWLPESPVYLVQQERYEKAQAILEWLRGPKADIESEMIALKNILIVQDSSMKESLHAKATIKGIALACGLMLFQQFTGISAYIFYLKFIFREKGFKASKEVFILTFAVAHLVATYVSSVIIERKGRKIWLFASGLVMLMASILMALDFLFIQDPDMRWLTTTATIMYSVAHGLGFGPLSWVIMTELFSDQVKPICCAIASTWFWIFMFIVVAVFPFVLRTDEPATIFVAFGLISCGACIFTINYIPETQNKSLRQILQALS